MSFTIMKYKAWEALAKKQAKIDEVLVFEEDFSSISRQLVQAQAECDVWLTWVDFAPTYRFEMSNQTLRLIGYDEVVAKANHWLARHATSSTSNSSSNSHPTLIHWSVLNCETLYAKILINFAENGDIKGKRVAAISKWPLQEENCLNNFDPNQALSKQNATNVLDGRYIVQLLRLWLVRSRDPAEALEYHRSSKHGGGGGGGGGPPPPRIGYRDYWPKMLPAKEGSRESSKGAKKVLEKMQEVTDRINLDIATGEVFTGPLLNVTTFPCYSTSGDNQSKMPSVDDGSELLKADQVINVVRVFFDASVDARQEDLVGFADFIPECISGGGFIKYPKFETQSRLVAKASRWLAANPEIRFLNSSSVDIKLRSMTSIDSSEMAFVRNTGDFIRILRICYTKPFESDESNPLEIVDLSRNPGPSTSYSHHSRSHQPPPPPPPAPIYLNVRNLFSSKNSTTELKGKLYEFLREPAFSPSATDTAHRWRILTAESLGIWGSSNKKGDDLWETSFHALSISSSSMMNRNAFDGVNVFYDTGYFGKTEEESNSPPAGGGNNPDDEEPEEARKKQALVPRSKGIPCSVL